MTKPKLRKKAEINHPQSPHDGIHTCSKGCSKPGCNRTLRDTIEEQDKQIEALKQDLLEKTAELRKSEEHNDALCERMQDLNSEIFTASNINGKLHMKRVHDLNQMGGQCEEIARLKAEVERLTKAGDAMVEIVNGTYCVHPPQALKDWNEAKMATWMDKTISFKAWCNAAKEGKQP